MKKNRERETKKRSNHIIPRGMLDSQNVVISRICERLVCFWTCLCFPFPTVSMKHDQGSLWAVWAVLCGISLLVQHRRQVGQLRLIWQDVFVTKYCATSKKSTRCHHHHWDVTIRNISLTFTSALEVSVMACCHVNYMFQLTTNETDSSLTSSDSGNTVMVPSHHRLIYSIGTPTTLKFDIL